MKLLTLILSFCSVTFMTYAQVGVGTTNPQAQLDIRSSNQASPTSIDGILIPKVDVFPTGVDADQNAMLVYLTITIGANAPGFYYYNHATTSWLSIGGYGAEKINDLIDGKSDNDGTQDGSSVFLGNGAGANDDSTDNQNVGIGYLALNSNTTGSNNVANGYQSLYSNITGVLNSAVGSNSLYFNTSGSYNVANGFQALYSNTTGSSNIATGYNSMNSNTTGYSNVAIGAQSLFTNISGYNNIAIGNQSLYSNTTGYHNSATGLQSLYSNTSGYRNVSNGYQSLYFNTTGHSNVAQGYQSLYSNTTGNNNVANGYQSLYSNTIGSYNVANGQYALAHNTSGVSNLASGYYALYDNTTGRNNVAIGSGALNSNTNGNYNSAIGSGALDSNSSGDNNTANGYHSLQNNTFGNNNVASGYLALSSNTNGDNNVAYGYQSLYNNTTGSNNIAIGYQSGYYESNSNKLYIENSAADADNALIYGEFDTDLLRINGILDINNAYRFPLADGVVNQVLLTDGAGNLSWQHSSGSPWIDSGTDVSYENVSVDTDLISINNQQINGTATSLRFGSTSGTYIGIFASSTELGVVNNGSATLGSNAFRWDEIWSVNPLNTTSDKRLKKEINALNYGLESIMKLKPVSYKWKTGKQDKKLGFLAQDVELVIPEVVSHKIMSPEEKKQYLSEGRNIPSEDLYAMTYSELIPVLVKAIQEQQQEIESLRHELRIRDSLETRILALEKNNNN